MHVSASKAPLPVTFGIVSSSSRSCLIAGLHRWETEALKMRLDQKWAMPFLPPDIDLPHGSASLGPGGSARAVCYRPTTLTSLPQEVPHNASGCSKEIVCIRDLA